RANTAQPLFRQHAIGSIIEPHHLVPAPQGFEQLGQARCGVPVLYLTLQLEPIHATRNFDADWAWAPADLSFGFDVPSSFHSGGKFGQQSKVARNSSRSFSGTEIEPCLRRAMIHSIGVSLARGATRSLVITRPAVARAGNVASPRSSPRWKKPARVHAVSPSRCSSRTKFQGPPSSHASGSRLSGSFSGRRKQRPVRTTKGMSMLANAGESRGDSGIGR